VNGAYAPEPSQTQKEPFVIATLLYGYLAGWGLTTIGMALVVRRLRPVPHPIPLAIAAGAAWPCCSWGLLSWRSSPWLQKPCARRRPAAIERPLPVEPVPEKCRTRRRSSLLPVNAPATADQSIPMNMQYAQAVLAHEQAQRQR